MLNFVETSLKILVKEDSFMKYKRLCEVHFTLREERFEKQNHSGALPCILVGVNEVVDFVAQCSGVYTFIYKCEGRT